MGKADDGTPRSCIVVPRSLLLGGVVGKCHGGKGNRRPEKPGQDGIRDRRVFFGSVIIILAQFPQAAMTGRIRDRLARDAALPNRRDPAFLFSGRPICRRRASDENAPSCPLLLAYPGYTLHPLYSARFFFLFQFDCLASLLTYPSSWGKSVSSDSSRHYLVMPRDDSAPAASLDANEPGPSGPLKKGDACLYCRRRRIKCSATKPSW